MSATDRLDDRITQDGWTVQPTHAEGEYRLSHDGIHVTFHGARLGESDGTTHVTLNNYGGGTTSRAAKVTLSDTPWRIEEWLHQLAAETMGSEA